MSNSISLCMVVKNEEKLLARSISSVREIVDEVVVVDTGSTDKTLDIAGELDARVVHYEWDGSLGRARNKSLRTARGDWILVLDGDEAVASSDLTKIKRLVSRRSCLGYCLAIRNYTDDYDLMWDWHPNDRTYPFEEKLSSCPGWIKTQPLRLFRNLPNVEYVEGSSVHTSPMTSLSRNSGRIEKRDDLIIHHFQIVKGGNGFLASKQQSRLAGEILHAKEFPDEPYTYLNIAKTLFAAKKDDEALEYLDQAIRLDASFQDAHQLWGMIDFENGRLASAETHLRQALQIAANSADVWTILGMVLVEDGRHNEGRRALEHAISIRPHHLLAHNSLGVLYEDLRMFPEARREYQIALKLHPRFQPARINFARLSKPNESRRNS